MNVTSIKQPTAAKFLKRTFIGAGLVTAGLLAGSLFKTPKVPESEMTTLELMENVVQQQKDKKAVTYYWNPRESVASNVMDGAKTTGAIIQQAADKATDQPVPLAVALAATTLAAGAAGGIAKRQEQSYKQKINQQQAEIERESAEEAKRIERQDARLSKIDEYMSRYTNNMYNFDFEKALTKFGVTDTKHPDKKGHNLTERAKNNVYTEYYTSKDGKIIEAGIEEFGRLTPGINSKDYNHAYVRVVNPTIPHKVCELGRVHITTEDGYAREYDLSKLVTEYDYSTDGSNSHPYRDTICLPENQITSQNKVVAFPEHEQQKREEISSSAETDFRHNIYDDKEYDEAERKLMDKIFHYKNYLIL